MGHFITLIDDQMHLQLVTTLDRGPFLHSPENVSGPKSHSENSYPLIL